MSAIIEALNLLKNTKGLLRDMKVKDRIIAGDKQAIRMVEGDFARYATNEYEICQNLLSEIEAENSDLKLQNSQLLEEIEDLRKALEFSEK